MKKDFKFDARADSHGTGFEGRFSKKFYSLVMDNVKISDRYHVLDAGCGTGTIRQLFLERYHISGAGAFFLLMKL